MTLPVNIRAKIFTVIQPLSHQSFGFDQPNVKLVYFGDKKKAYFLFFH